MSERQTTAQTTYGAQHDWPNTSDPLAWGAEFSRALDMEDRPDAEWMASWFEAAMAQAEPPLDDEVEVRARALMAAREAIINKAGAFSGTEGPDATELIRLASWIVTGTDPWTRDTYEITSGNGDVKHVWADGHGVVAVQDTELPPEDRDG